MARRFGVATPDVILLPIGGVARLQRLPEEPKQEFLIALAGPLVTLVLAVLFGVASYAAGGDPIATAIQRSDGGILAQLSALNTWLLLFNLIPAFPMDGGRVLRAALASRMPLPRATRVAARVGQALAFLRAVYGIERREWILVLIAAFVMLGAGSELAAVTTRFAGRGVQVSQMMVTDFRTIAIHATLAQAAELLLSTEQREFPVVDNLGRVEGILTRDGLVRGLAEHGPNAIVAESMVPRVPAIPPTLDFEHALGALRASGLPALPVVDASGALVGLLTADNIADLLLVKRARGEA
jgi:CBS domain-containing protein